MESLWALTLSTQVLADNLSMYTFIVDAAVTFIIPGGWCDLEILQDLRVYHTLMAYNNYNNR